MSESNSLERMLAVLGAFTEDRLEWTSEELMAHLGYSRPTLYRYLKTLRRHGLLTSLPNAGFTLGPRVVEMDFLLRRSDPLVLHGAEFVRRLAAAHPCTALLVRWYGDKVLCVHSENSAPDPKSSYPRGRPMAVTKGAVARAILAFLPRRQLVAIVERNLAEFAAAGSGETVEAVLDMHRKVRKAGVAVARGEVTPGVIGFAAPVYDEGHAPIASICVTIAERLADAGRIDAIACEVRAAGNALSCRIATHRAGDRMSA